MPTYSVAEAKANLSRLIDQALAGDEVVISRRGKDAVMVKSVGVPAAGNGKRFFDEEWFRTGIVRPAKRQSETAEETVRAIREDRDI